MPDDAAADRNSTASPHPTGSAAVDRSATGAGADDPSATDVDDGAPALPDPERFSISPPCSHDEFLAVARVYARRVAEAADLSVPVSELEWSVSTRAKRRAGAVRYRDGEPREVVLTWEQFAEAGWAAVAETIRHELAHVHLLVEAGDPGHGPAFRELADRLDARRHCDRFAEPAWWVTCRDCGARLARYRRSKLVESPEEYRCGDCGGTFEVERND